MIGLLMQSDIAKSDGINYDLRIRWPKSSDRSLCRFYLIFIKRAVSNITVIRQVPSTAAGCLLSLQFGFVGHALSDTTINNSSKYIVTPWTIVNRPIVYQ